jgi:putative addiction module component (TIGR02574 family)
MATPFESVAEQALTLSAPERLRLANELLESVEPGSSEEIEEAWEAEIQRRITEIDAGRAKGRPWTEIKREFHSRYGR